MGYRDETCVISDLGITNGCRVYAIYLVQLRSEWHPTSGLIPGVYTDHFEPDDASLLESWKPERKSVELVLMRADVVDHLAPLAMVNPRSLEAIRLGVAEGKSVSAEGYTAEWVRLLLITEAAATTARENGFGFGSYLELEARTHLWGILMKAPPSDYPEWARLSDLFLTVKHLLGRGWYPKPCTWGVQDSRTVSKYRSEYHRFLSLLP